MASKPRSSDASKGSAIAAERAVVLARGAGLEVRETEDWRVTAVGPSGAVTLPVLAFRGPDRAGEPKSLARLADRIASSLGEWRFSMHVERPLQADVDVEPIARAALLWRMALDKGEKRRHARYSDDDADIDLSVTERKGSGGMHVGLGPLVTAERLVGVYAACREAVRGVAPAGGDVVLVLHADPAWSLPRGYVLDMLYGTPECVVVDDGWRAAYRPQTSALFVCEPRLLAVWFVAGPEGPGFHATAFENPWHPRTGSVTLPGGRCAATDPAFAASLLRTRPPDLRAVAFSSLAPTPWSTP